MYSQKAIERKQAKVEESLGIKLIRYEVGDVHDRCQALQDILSPRGVPLRELKPEEKDFVRNERLLVKIDFNYWLGRYPMALQDQGGLGYIKAWESQNILLKHISQAEDEMLERLDNKEPVDGILIGLHKDRQLGACLRAGTRVLTADYRWVPIETIKPGDGVVSVDENAGTQGVARKMRRGTVLGTCQFDVPTMRLTLDDGAELEGTPHHRFLARVRGGTTVEWRQIKNMKPGDKIRRAVPVWDSQQCYEDGWFGGFLDGEGSLLAKASGGAALCGAQVRGAVLDRAFRYLNQHNHTYRLQVDKRTSGEKSKLGNQEVVRFDVSRMHDIFKILGRCRPSRLLEKKWWEGKELPNHGGDTWATVISVEVAGTQRVYDFETTTHTYIAEGLVSHNTLIGRCLDMHRCTTNSHIRAIAASLDDDKILEMYDRDKVILNNLPWWMKPEIGFDEKAQHLYFEKLGSRILYQTGNQKFGVGQGRQFDIGHLTECASWPNPLTIEHDYFPTIPQSMLALHILETTAQGRGDWWHNFVKLVRKGITRRWRFVFIPWYVEASKYNAHPPADWKPTDLSMKYAQHIYETSPEFCFGKQVLLSREKLYWYETTRNEYQARNSLNIFFSNYAATPEESFQHSTRSAFDYETLERLRMGVRDGAAYQVSEPREENARRAQ